MSDWNLLRNLRKIIEWAVYFPYIRKKTNFNNFERDSIYFYFNKPFPCSVFFLLIVS